ncbi:MAG: helix-turn-helix transcriptional regulator [Jannaschia sp.]
MTDRLFAAGARIEGLRSIGLVWSECLDCLAAEGIEIVLYLSSDDARTDVRVFGNKPAIHAKVPASDDPFLGWCCVNYDTTFTGIEYLEDHPYLPESARSFIRAAAGHGFTSGLAIPMRLEGSPRFGGFNLGTGLDRAAFAARIAPKREALRFFCLIVHRKLEELGFESLTDDVTDAFGSRLPAPACDALSVLTPREREVIYLQAQGLPRKEVARMCGISPYTVAEYTSKAYRKLGINNRSQAARLVFGA